MKKKTYPVGTMNPSHPLWLTCRDAESISGSEDPLPRPQTPPRLSPAPPVQEGRRPGGTQGLASWSAGPGLCSKWFLTLLIPLTFPPPSSWVLFPLMTVQLSHRKRKAPGMERSSLSLPNWITYQFPLATHSSILAWRILWTEEPGGLLSIGLHRVGHNWSDVACMHWRRKRQSTPVFLPRESHGQRSLVGCCP